MNNFNFKHFYLKGICVFKSLGFSPRIKVKNINQRIFFSFSAEIRRLLKEYPENQEFVRNLESQFYITYPQQVQRHGKGQGISTRDASKVAVSKTFFNHLVLSVRKKNKQNKNFSN